MAFEQLLAALEREASIAADRLLVNARAEAERIREQHELDITQRRNTAVAAVTQEQRAALERDIAAVERTARRETLAARERWLDRVFHSVREVLPAAVHHESYQRALAKRIAAAVACFDPSDAMVLRCPASLVAVLQPIVAGNSRVALQADEQAGSGFRLSNAEGMVEVDDSLEARLEHSHSILARVALAQLENQR